MTLAREHRLYIPVGVKLHAALLMLGFSEDEIAGGIQWNHKPALALRVVDPETGQLDPHPNDPRYLEPLRTADHLQVTTGRRPGAERTATTAGSDIGNAAKVKRLERARQQREANADDEIDRAARVDRGGDDMKRVRRSRWPKGQKIRSRGFQQNRRKA